MDGKDIVLYALKRLASKLNPRIGLRLFFTIKGRDRIRAGASSVIIPRLHLSNSLEDAEQEAHFQDEWEKEEPEGGKNQDE